MKCILVWLTIPFLLPFKPVLHSQNVKASELENLCISNVRILNASGAFGEPVDVLYTGTGIDTITTSNTIEKQGFNVVDATGKYLVPAYCDAHIHLPESQFTDNYIQLLKRFGILNARSMRGPGEDASVLNDFKAQGIHLSLSTTPTSWRDTLGESASLEQMKKDVELGAEFVKILSVNDTSQLAYTVRNAQALGLPLTGHFVPGQTMAELGKKGYVTVEHLGGIYGVDSLQREQHLESMLTYKIAATPTLTWYAAGCDSVSRGLSKLGIEYMDSTSIREWIAKDSTYNASKSAEELRTEQLESCGELARRLAAVRQLNARGVDVLVGSDPSGFVGIPGFDYRMEVDLLSAAGMSQRELLLSMTATYWEYVKREVDNRGVQPGSTSNTLILGSNPLESTQNMFDIEYLVVDGRIETPTGE